MEGKREYIYRKEDKGIGIRVAKKDADSCIVMTRLPGRNSMVKVSNSDMVEIALSILKEFPELLQGHNTGDLTVIEQLDRLKRK